MESISANIVDAVAGEIFPATLTVAEGRIARIVRETAPCEHYLIPPLVDAHVHVESSLLTPAAFARLAVAHGTVAAVADPHEIANVMGIEGVDFMIEDGARVPFKFFFGAPSCVPATPFESSGATLDVEAVTALLRRKDIWFLSEMMNFPAVISGDGEVLAKIRAAHQVNKPVDGHAPGLRGEPLAAYVAAGIQTDHETLTHEEAAEKLALGMKLMLREGSAAKNFDEMADFLASHPGRCMLCTDDCHPDDLAANHIDNLVRRAIQRGIAPLQVLQAASVTPVRHYGLPVGLLQEGDPADWVRIDGFESVTILETRIGGQVVARDGQSLLEPEPAQPVNRFEAVATDAETFSVPHSGGQVRVIHALDGQLVTEAMAMEPKVVGGKAVPDPDRDLLKLAVVNRYRQCPPAVAFVHGFGLQSGAIASSVAHDSHNIVAVGTSDAEISRAVNRIVHHRGGLAAVRGDTEEVLPLPVAGLMTTVDGYRAADSYGRLNAMAISMGSRLQSPFMTLSFMSLLVIPSLKLSDRGLFDADTFSFLPLQLRKE
ncbi:MAG: adenine deaminase [Desulfobacteraceae bacterium]|nr:adenine deaminase [Desulfobacteraceae bacterium]